MEMMKQAKRYNRISTIILCVLFLLIAPMQVPKLWGWQMFAILTGSMEPDIPTGSVIYVKEQSLSEIEVDDVITFRLGSNRSNTATHRVIEKQENGLITKGDANEHADATIVNAQQLIGKVVCTIPIYGYFLMLASNPIGIVMFFILLLVVGLFAWKARNAKDTEN